MTLRHTPSPRQRRTPRHLVLAVGASMCLLTGVPAATAAAPGAVAIGDPVVAVAEPGAAALAPAVGAPVADPPAFVPDWDGHTDSTRIAWQLDARSRVQVLLLDARGRTHEVLLTEVQEVGAHETWWDGRDADGDVLSPGAWRVRVIATPLAAPVADPNAPGSANMGGTAAAPATIGATVRRDVAVTLQEPPVAIRSVRVTRGAIGRAAAISKTQARFHLSAAASVAAAVVDSNGRVVRSLRNGSMAKGSAALAWDGRLMNGKPVADGSYALLVAASGSGRPTNTLRVPLRVDRKVPTFAASIRTRATTTSTRVVVPIKVTVDEPATVSVRLGKRNVTFAQPAGSRTVRLRGDSLGIVPSRRARVVKLLVLAADATGNARASRVLVVVPAVAKPRPVVQRPVDRTPTTVGPPIAAGKLGWPVQGVVTSEFGPRSGRMHQGIDIGVAEGTPIHASAAGTVLSVGTMDGYGIQVTLAHANTLSTRYAHMSAPALGLVAGDTVAAGQLLGLSGCTGRCFGPHVHFETRVGDVPRDPRAFLG